MPWDSNAFSNPGRPFRRLLLLPSPSAAVVGSGETYLRGGAGTRASPFYALRLRICRDAGTRPLIVERAEPKTGNGAAFYSGRHKLRGASGDRVRMDGEKT